MLRWFAALLLALLLGEAPAFAGACRTQGSANAPITFPTNDAADVPFARAMAPVMLPEISSTVSRTPTCIRFRLQTPGGDYVVGGENGDAFPRVAVPADARAGAIVYLAPSPIGGGGYALVALRETGAAVVTRFYAAIPTDAHLKADIPAALSGEAGIMRYDPARRMVVYGFRPPQGAPPPVVTGTRPDGSYVVAGPQILIAGTADPDTLDAGSMRHKPSGLACPERLAQLAVTLLSVDPRKNSLVCSYRPGTDPAFKPDDPIRYQLTLDRARPGDTARSVFDQLSASARASLRIKGEHAPPLAAGRIPSPEFVAFWDTEDEGVQGVWVGRAGAWIVWLRAQYPPGTPADAEAGKVADILFGLVAREVK